MSIENEFAQAVARTSDEKNAHISLSNDIKLKLYGLYKQAKLGNATGTKPWKIKMTEYAKWNAWDAQRDKSETMAMLEYVDIVNKHFGVPSESTA